MTEFGQDTMDNVAPMDESVVMGGYRVSIRNGLLTVTSVAEGSVAVYFPGTFGKNDIEVRLGSAGVQLQLHRQR